jgi:hypothetical protein
VFYVEPGTNRHGQCSKTRLRFNSTHVYGTRVPVEEPSTASKGDIPWCGEIGHEIGGVAYSITSGRSSPSALAGQRIGITVCDTDDAAQAVAMYSRSALDSDAISATRYLTTSPIETIPASLPSSITGTCRNFPVVIRSISS